jgi:hypothetical protein
MGSIWRRKLSAYNSKVISPFFSNPNVSRQFSNPAIHHLLLAVPSITRFILFTRFFRCEPPNFIRFQPESSSSVSLTPIPDAFCKSRQEQGLLQAFPDKVPSTKRRFVESPKYFTHLDASLKSKEANEKGYDESLSTHSSTDNPCFSRQDSHVDKIRPYLISSQLLLWLTALFLTLEIIYSHLFQERPITMPERD